MAKASTLGKGKGGMLRGVFALAGGVALAQCIRVGMSPIISRIFSPDAYGIAGVFVATAAVISPVFCLRYEQALMLPKDDRDAANIFVLCTILGGVFAALCFAMVAAAGQTVLLAFNLQEMGEVIWLLPIGVWCAALVPQFRFWNSRHKRFRLSGVVRAVAQLVAAVCIIMIGWLGFRSGRGLIVARVLGVCVPPVVFIACFFRLDFAFVARSVSWARMWDLAKRYKRFPLFDTWSGLIQVAATQLPILFIAAYFTKHAAGLYAMALLVVQMPSLLISNAVAHVVFQRTAEMQSKKQPLGEQMVVVLKNLPLLGLLPATFIILVGPELFAFVFGARWMEAGVYAGILATYALVQFITAPVGVLFLVLERQVWNMISNVIFLAGTLASFVLCAALGADIRWGLAMMSTVGAVVLLWRAVFILHLIDVHMRVLAWSFGSDFLCMLPTIAIIGTAKWVFQFSWFGICLACVVSTIPWTFFLLCRNVRLRSAIQSRMKGILKRQ